MRIDFTIAGGAVSQSTIAALPSEVVVKLPPLIEIAGTGFLAFLTRFLYQATDSFVAAARIASPGCRVDFRVGRSNGGAARGCPGPGSDDSEGRAVFASGVQRPRGSVSSNRHIFRTAIG